MQTALAATVAALLAATAACHGNPNRGAAAVAADQWTRSFPIVPDGEVRIANRTGRIEVEGVSGSTVEIRAERIVHAASDKSAHDLLSRIAISEDAKPDLVAIATEGIPGILIGVSVEVNFHVRLPPTAHVRAQLTNGDVTAEGIAGGTLSTVNGRITGSNLRGNVEAHVVNGRINLEMAGLADGRVNANATNGSIELKVPTDADATLSASTVNGQVHVIDLPFTPDAEADNGDRRRGRRTSGHINAGGTPIDLRSVNGSITIRPR